MLPICLYTNCSLFREIYENGPSTWEGKEPLVVYVHSLNIFFSCTLLPTETPDLLRLLLAILANAIVIESVLVTMLYTTF
uniref:Transmembrane protein n=1 Tax=Medicago truncatula TaxID=3880 RepID=I3SFX0_MEDTR|nr:unknown [Medicago truncatula]